MEKKEVYELLRDIQLENFYTKITENLQITRLSHFDYVKPKDLEKIGLSKPAIRRLLDAVNKKKNLLIPSRPAPPPPILKNSLKTDSATLKKVLSGSKLSSLIQKGSESSFKDLQLKGVSYIINPNDIQILKNTKGDEILGSGNFGVVKKGIWNSPNGSKLNVAVKCLHQNNIDSNNPNKQQAILDIINEITCMCGLDHVNLIKLYGVILNGSNSENSIISMVTELATFGSLLKYLDQNREHKNIPLRKLYSFIFQIADGMEYLEQKNLIHRDLAARNILLSSLDHVKICDFGMTRNAVNGLYTMTETHKIPCAWYPPESIREKIFSIKSDVWAFGVTVWEIFSFGEHPWPNMTAGEMLQKIDFENKRLSIPYTCSKDFYKIISSCWSKSPDDRPSFKILKSLIKQFKIIEMKAKVDFAEENKLGLVRGDMITIIDGSVEKYWWKGQNNRTLLTGSFPRALLDTQKNLNGDDISLPLKNSFIHTGHMGPDSQKVWGNPGKIDELFLRNPLIPPDLLGDIDEDKIEDKQQNSESSNSSSTTNFEDLIGLFDNPNQIKVSHPEFSIESSASKSLKDIVSLDFSNQLKTEHSYQNQNYVPNPPALPPLNKQTYQNYAYHHNLPSFNSSYKTANKNQVYSSTNPFNQDSSQNSSELVINQNLNMIFVNNNFKKDFEENSKPNFYDHVIKPSNEPNKKENLDDLLQKVMFDVFSDFNNLKVCKN